jgi:hypothetical protein
MALFVAVLVAAAILIYSLYGIWKVSICTDRLCGLVVRVLGYRSGTRVRFPALPGKEKIMDLERSPLRLVSTTVELTENTAIGIRHADHVAPSIRKSWQSLRRQAAVARSV